MSPGVMFQNRSFLDTASTADRRSLELADDNYVGNSVLAQESHVLYEIPVSVDAGSAVVRPHHMDSITAWTSPLYASAEDDTTPGSAA